MANEHQYKISQIQVDDTTYDICDATARNAPVWTSTD